MCIRDRSNTKKLDKINKLIKKEIKIKKEIPIFSSVIFLSELKIVLLIILLGLMSLIVSPDVIFKRIYILVNLIPDVLDTSDPPIIVINRKYKLKLLLFSINVIPELEILLKTLIIVFKTSELLK